MNERSLIVNADDFGMTDGVNAGIVEAHERGIVTSASLMVRQGAARAAAEYAAEHPDLAVGLHLDFGQWDYVNGEWAVAYEHCDTDDLEAVQHESLAQLVLFRQLLDRDPTHIDSHQHVHMSEPVASVAARHAAGLEVPLRGQRIRYEGGFYGQTGKGEPVPEAITTDALLAIIRSLDPGWTEIGCHPGLGLVEESSYAAERDIEVRTLCDPGIGAEIERLGIELRSFADI
jgi:predicted glycoside hydrolase/deacetylase ChbG (UPF0249 family)